VIDPRVQADFDELHPHLVSVRCAQAYIGDSDDQTTVLFAPPVIFRITGGDCLGRTNDDWLDPIYDIEPCDPRDPQVQGYRSFYCYGASYNTKTGETQHGDIVGVHMSFGNHNSVAKVRIAAQESTADP
jgi:hypothetical protein